MLNALYSAQENPRFYSIAGFECERRTMAIIRDSLGPAGTNYNPIHDDTGNIWDYQNNWVGWEDFDSGNIYDANGDWAGWDRNWDSDSGAGGSSGSVMRGSDCGEPTGSLVLVDAYGNFAGYAVRGYGMMPMDGGNGGGIGSKSGSSIP
jgi:hypothetical protein